MGELIAASSEDLVPPDHFYRPLDRTLALAFARGLVKDACAEGGRPSVDPVVLFKLQLIPCFEGLRSERRLLRVAADRLSLRWYLGYAVTEPLPERSSLARIRDRFGLAVCRRCFEAIVEQCVAAGLVWGRELYADSTNVAANASLDSLQPRFAGEAHLARLLAETEAEAGAQDVSPDEAVAAPATPPIALTDEARAALADRAAARHDWIGEAGKPDRDAPSGAYRRTADCRVSPTDPDASPTPFGIGRTRLGYHDPYVVDGGKGRTTLTALVTPAEVQDNQPALALPLHARFRWKLRPRQVAAAAKYGTAENAAAIEREGIPARVPLSDVGHRAGLFRDTDFAYDAATDTDRCPGDPPLRFVSRRDRTRRRVYGAPAAAGRARAEGPLHRLPTGAARWAQLRRGYPRPGPGLPRRRAVRRGDAQAPGVGRARVRRGQGPRTGTGCGGSGCGGWSRSTRRHR